MSDETVEQAAPDPLPPPPRTPIACARCGAEVGPDQAWCLECGLAARTRVAPTPNWRAPLVVAGLVGLACIVALVVAFLTITGDNAPLPQTAATAAPPADTTPTTTVPPVTPSPTTSVPVNTVPTIPPQTTTVPTTPVPAPTGGTAVTTPTTTTPTTTAP